MRGIANAALALGLLFTAPPALAQSRGELAEAIERLSSRSPSEVREGIEALGLLGNTRAVRPLADRIARGLPPDLLDMAIETLSILGDPAAGPVLFRLAHHRRAEVRLGAARAIASTNPPGAARALAGALSDSDPRVRGAAADGLGMLGGAAGIDALFLATQRHVPEAPTALGRIARPADVERLLGLIGSVGFDAMTPAISELLGRDDLADAAKLAVVVRLTELATPGARQLLSDFVDMTPEQSGGRARRAAVEALPRMQQ